MTDATLDALLTQGHTLIAESQTPNDIPVASVTRNASTDGHSEVPSLIYRDILHTALPDDQETDVVVDRSIKHYTFRNSDGEPLNLLANTNFKSIITDPDYNGDVSLALDSENDPIHREYIRVRFPTLNSDVDGIYLYQDRSQWDPSSRGSRARSTKHVYPTLEYNHTLEADKEYFFAGYFKVVQRELNNNNTIFLRIFGGSTEATYDNANGSILQGYYSDNSGNLLGSDLRNAITIPATMMSVGTWVVVFLQFKLSTKELAYHFLKVGSNSPHSLFEEGHNGISHDKINLTFPTSSSNGDGDGTVTTNSNGILPTKLHISLALRGIEQKDGQLDIEYSGSQRGMSFCHYRPMLFKDLTDNEKNKIVTTFLQGHTNDYEILFKDINQYENHGLTVDSSDTSNANIATISGTTGVKKITNNSSNSINIHLFQGTDDSTEYIDSLIN